MPDGRASAKHAISSEPLDLPQWQLDEFKESLNQWQTTLHERAHDEGEPGAGHPRIPALPDVVRCYSENPKAAFHFHSFAVIVMQWRGDAISQSGFDGLIWLRHEERKVIMQLKQITATLEKHFENGKVLGRTCLMELRDLSQAVYGSRHIDESTASNSLTNHMKCLAICLSGDRHSRWWTLYHDTCTPLLTTFQDTLSCCGTLYHPTLDGDESSALHDEIPLTSVPLNSTEQSGLRRRRPDALTQSTTAERNGNAPDEDPKSHAEEWSRLAKALSAVARAYSFSDLTDALWRDERSPVVLSIITTSITSILLGVAIAAHERQYCSRSRPGVDHEFFTLLADTVIQLFSLYVLLLPFLRGQEPNLRSIWFGLSVSVSMLFLVVSAVVYPFQWHTATVLRYVGTLAALVASLLLVQGIDKRNTAKDTDPHVENSGGV